MMESALRILLIRGWFLVWTTVTAIEQRFASQPSPQTAIIGSTVVLPCRIIGRVGEVQWTRDDFGLGNERELYAFERYQMIGSDEEGDFSLRISPVTLEDDARFQCQVTGWTGVPGVRSQSAKLTVYAPPEAPTIAPGPLVTTTAGVGVQLECTSNLGKPAAELQWLDGSGHVVKEGVQYTTVRSEDGHRYNTTSTLSFLARSEHHESLFTCFASSPALNEPASAQVRLEVIYQPEITMTTDLTGYREGQTATLTCSARANPNVLTYRWFRNGEQVTVNNSTQLIIENITRLENISVSCEVSNEFGASKKSIRLPIHYGPVFVEPPVDQYADIGEEVSLLCEVDGSPDPRILWISQRTQGVVGKGPKLDLNVTENTIGRYLCLAKVEDFPEISTLVGVFTKVPPRVSCDPDQWSKLGDTAKLECTIAGTSVQSLKIIWTRHGKEINLENDRYKVEQWVTRDGIRHTLSIRGAKEDDFGSYNFSAHNDFGSDFFEMVLRQTKKLPFVIMVGGVTGGIVFVVVVLTLVVICARKSATSQKEAKKLVLPEKTVSFQMNDQSSTSTDSDLKVEGSQKNGTAMISRKCADVESWKNEANRVMESAYLTSSSSKPYIYPDTYTAVPIRTNGHLRRKSESYCFSNYADHAVLMDHQQPQRVSPPAGEFMRTGNGARKSLGAGVGSRAGSHLRASQDLVSASQYTLYPRYDDDYGIRAHVEENHRFSHAYGDGVSNPSFKASCGSLPLSFHVNSRTCVAKGHPPTGRPRLGTQALPNHYYAPGTQLLDGSLATHV